jgi:hypothetical protein
MRDQHTDDDPAVAGLKILRALDPTIPAAALDHPRGFLLGFRWAGFRLVEMKPHDGSTARFEIIHPDEDQRQRLDTGDTIVTDKGQIGLVGHFVLEEE